MLWSYLGLPEPQHYSQEAKILGFPAYYRERQGAGSPSFLLNQSVELASGERVNPWGYKDGVGNVLSMPITLPRLADSGLSTVWAMKDVDQSYVSSSTGWYSQLPKKPIFGKVRVVLNFDGSSGTIPTDEAAAR